MARILVRNDSPIQAGSRFGRLTITAILGRNGRKSHSRFVECQCDCGRKSIVRDCDLTSGKQRSCGCLMREISKITHRIHGHTSNGKQSPEYHSWQMMWQRVKSKKQKDVNSYSSRGISICDRWKSFERFLEDMGPRPAGMSLDRKNNDGHYVPGNCRWATRGEQRRNTRQVHWITFRGETRCLADWADSLGFKRPAIRYRIKHGWSVERALTTPARKLTRKTQRSARWTQA